MKSILLCMLFCPILGFAAIDDSTGVLSGSIFRTYNYDTHRPEVGAEIKLYNETTLYFKDGISINEDKVIVGKSDIEGRFSFKNIEPGTYLIVVNSHESIARPYVIYSFLKFKSIPIMKIAGYDFRAANKDMITKIDSLFDQYYNFRAANETKKGDKIEVELNKQIDILIKSLPPDIKYLLRVNGSYTTSKHVEELEIKQGLNNDLTIEFK